MYDRPVIPHNEIVALPFEAEGVFRPDSMLPKNFQYLFTFTRREPHDFFQEARADIEDFFFRLRMNANNRMFRGKTPAFLHFPVFVRRICPDGRLEFVYAA